MNNDLDQIEEKLKEKKAEEEKTHHKVSGRSVFQIKKIIQDKGEKKSSQEDNIGTDKKN